MGDPEAAVQVAQVALRLQYQDLVRRSAPLPEFADVEFRCYPQNGEDGILLYLFSLLGATNRRSVEICAGAGIECNTANLIINHGWLGLLVDGDPAQIAAGRNFYSRCKTTLIAPPTLVDSWVTTDNVNALVTDHGFAGNIDLLSSSDARRATASLACSRSASTRSSCAPDSARTCSRNARRRNVSSEPNVCARGTRRGSRRCIVAVSSG